MKSVITFLLCALMLLLSGCVRYDESIELDENGKGTAKIVMSRPKRGFLEKATFRASDFDGRFSEKAMGEKLPDNVKLTWSEKEQGERIEVTAVYAFDDINTLIGWAMRSDSPLKNISITRTKDSIEYTRKFGALEQEQMEAVKKYGIDIPLTFRLKGPGRLDVTNATRQEGATAIWEYKAPELLDGSKDFKAVYSFGVSPVLIGLVVFFLLGAAATAIVIRKKKIGQRPAGA